MAVAQPFHEGEDRMHKLMHVPETDNPTTYMLTPYAVQSLQRVPLLAAGTLDSDKRPWTTIWGGDRGLSAQVGRNIIGVKTVVDRKYDPVVDALFGNSKDGELVQEKQPGRMISALTIDLEPRKRVKLFGRMIAGAVAGGDDDEEENGEVAYGQMQLVMKIEQTLGNCPKYINSKEIHPAAETPELLPERKKLTKEGVDLIHETDLFFMSSANADEDMDTNHRGGPVGFVRVQDDESGKSVIVWPEYSGNRLYQSLGNLIRTPTAGLVFPNFVTGDVLYVTGNAEVLIGRDAAKVLPRSNLAVKLTVTEARYVKKGLPFRGIPKEQSPYNPALRLLASEREAGVAEEGPVMTAILLKQIPISSTISRFVFQTANQQTWKPGQWVAFDFSDELDMGYSHMRDDDPLSINDDFIRTFTVSSPPAPRNKHSNNNNFEITIRRVGRVTDFLFRHKGPKQHFETKLRGFGGDFRVQQSAAPEVTCFVAGGIGITPVYAQISELDVSRLVVLWTLRADDVELAEDLTTTHPQSAPSLRLFLTGVEGGEDGLTEAQKRAVEHLRKAGATVEVRRLAKDDLNVESASNRWYLCCSGTLRKNLLGWLDGRECVFEDFGF